MSLYQNNQYNDDHQMLAFWEKLVNNFHWNNFIDTHIIRSDIS